MSDQSFLSNATNFGLTTDYHINLRTGNLNFALNLASIAHVTSLQRTLNLIYSPNANGHFGLPSQWSFNLSYIQNDTIYVDGAKSYRLLDDQTEDSGLKYYKIKDMKLELFLTDPQTLPYTYGEQQVQYYYKLSHLNGNHQYFDFHGKLIAVDDKFGMYILLYYAGTAVDEAILTKIIDYYGCETSITINNNEIKIDFSGQVYTLSTSLDGIEKVEDSIGNTTQLTYKGGSKRTLLSQLDKSNGLSTFFEYTDLSYIQKDSIYHRDAVSATKTLDQQGNITKQTTYEYVSDININNYTGYPQYKVDDNEDIMLQSKDNDFKYITRVTDDTFVTLYHYNRLHLELKKEIFTAADNTLIAKEIYNYCGQGSNDYFPPYNDLPNNYQTPTQVVTVVSDPNNNNTRVYKTDSEFDDYGQLTTTRRYQSAIGDETQADTLTMLSETRLVYDYADDQYRNKPYYYGTVTKKYEYDYTQAQSKIYVQYHKLSGDLKTVVQKTVGTASTETINIAQKDISFVSEKTSEYTYDSLGRVTHEKLSLAYPNAAAGISSTEYRMEYTVFDKKLTTTLYNAKGYASKKVQDLRYGTLIQEMDALGNQHTYEYDKLDRKVKETDAIGSVTQWQYDDKQNIVTTLYANGYMTKRYMDAFGNSLKSTDNMTENGKERILSQVTYNNIGQVISQQGMRGSYSIIRYEYDNRGLIKGAFDAFNNDISETLDPVALSQQASFNTFKMNESLMNDHGKVSQVTLFDSNKNPVMKNEAKYNAFDKLVWGMQGNKDKGSYVEYTSDYNYEMNPTASTVKTNDGHVLTSSNTLDIFGNALQNKLSLITPDGKTTYATSDYVQTNPLNQVAQVKNNLNQVQILKYDEAGRAIELKDYAGTTFNYTYNADGTIRTHEFTDVSGKKCCRSMVYDKNTKLLLSLEESIDNQSQGAFKYQYRLDGKLTAMTYPDGKSIRYTYNQYNNIATSTDIKGNVTTYTYDDYGRVISVATADKKNSVALTYFSKTENPKQSGQIKTKVYDNGLMESFVYDDFSRVSEYVLTDSTVVSSKALLTLRYTYDEIKGSILRLDSFSEQMPADARLNHTKEYTYDGLNRLTKGTVKKLNGKLIQSVEYIYDVASNITYTKTIESDGGFKEETFTYDADNKLLSLTDNIGTHSFTYDANGNLLNDSRGKSYTYDTENRLTSFNDSVAKISATYAYYATGLRKQKTVNDSQPITFYYDTADLPNIINEVQGNSVASYLMAGSKRILRCVDSDGKGSNRNVEYMIYNYKDVVAALDQKKSINQSNNYDPYGRRRNFNLEIKQKRAKSTLTENPFGYNGEYTDAESEFVYLRTRYYNPNIQRFITRDIAITFNRYAYCNGNPVMLTDPSGCNPCSSSFISKGSTEASSVVRGITNASKNLGKSVEAGMGMGTSMVVVGVVVAVAIIVISLLGLFGIFSGSGSTSATASAGGGRPPRKPNSELSKVSGLYDVKKIMENAKQTQAINEFSKSYPGMDLNSVYRADGQLQRAFNIVYPELRGGLRGGQDYFPSSYTPFIVSALLNALSLGAIVQSPTVYTVTTIGLPIVSLAASIREYYYNPPNTYIERGMAILNVIVLGLTLLNFIPGQPIGVFLSNEEHWGPLVVILILLFFFLPLGLTIIVSSRSSYQGGNNGNNGNNGNGNGNGSNIILSS